MNLNFGLVIMVLMAIFITWVIIQARINIKEFGLGRK